MKRTEHALEEFEIESETILFTCNKLLLNGTLNMGDALERMAIERTIQKEKIEKMETTIKDLREELDMVKQFLENQKKEKEFVYNPETNKFE